MKALGRATIGLIITYLIIAGLFYILFGATAAVGICLLLLGVITYAHIFFDKKLSKHFNLQILPEHNPYSFTASVKKYCLLAKINTPLIYTSEHNYHQAFCFGSSYNKQSIVIFTQVLDKFSAKELDTLAALLIAQIKNTIASLFINFIFIATQSLDEVFRFLTGFKGSPLKRRANMVTFLNAPFIYTYLCLFHSPKLIFAADKLASTWTGNQQQITRLLLKLHTYNLTPATPPPLKYSHLFITSPLTPLHWTTYLIWQPKIKERTLNLVGHYPA